jgi:hypothetical protein
MEISQEVVIQIVIIISVLIVSLYGLRILSRYVEYKTAKGKTKEKD